MSTTNGAHPHCGWCDEAVLPADRRAPIRGGVFHHECGMRIIFGSVAHIEGRCGCNVPGCTDTDPPGMTKRQAAKAAVAAYRRKEEKGAQ